MRPIEFRGKSINQNMWLYGNLFQWGLTKGVLCVCCCVPNSYRDVYDIYAVNPETIGQYTGLKDKNGTKIFEGDIIASHGYTHIIEYEEQQARFVATRFEFSIVSKDSCSLTKLWIDECDKVVVGNIHERKEM